MVVRTRKQPQLVFTFLIPYTVEICVSPQLVFPFEFLVLFVISHHSVMFTAVLCTLHTTTQNESLFQDPVVPEFVFLPFAEVVQCVSQLGTA